MQASSEASVHEEHQIGDPPLMIHQVCLCITFFVRLCITFSNLVLEETQIGDPPLPPQDTCIFVDIGIYIFFMQLDSEQVVLEEHPIRVVVSEAPRPTITYSHTVSKNVILVCNLNKCTYNFYSLVN